MDGKWTKQAKLAVFTCANLCAGELNANEFVKAGGLAAILPYARGPLDSLASGDEKRSEIEETALLALSNIAASNVGNVTHMVEYNEGEIVSRLSKTIMTQEPCDVRKMALRCLLYLSEHGKSTPVVSSITYSFHISHHAGTLCCECGKNRAIGGDAPTHPKRPYRLGRTCPRHGYDA